MHPLLTLRWVTRCDRQPFAAPQSGPAVLDGAKSADLSPTTAADQPPRPMPRPQPPILLWLLLWTPLVRASANYVGASIGGPVVPRARHLRRRRPPPRPSAVCVKWRTRAGTAAWPDRNLEQSALKPPDSCSPCRALDRARSFARVRARFRARARRCTFVKPPWRRGIASRGPPTRRRYQRTAAAPHARRRRARYDIAAPA